MAEGLKRIERIDKSELQGKLESQCLQFGVYPRSMVMVLCDVLEVTS